MFDLDRIVAPTGIEAFLSRYWEREPLHIARNDPDFYAGFFDLEDLDGLLVHSRMGSQDLRVESKERGCAFAALAGMNRPPSERHRGPHLRPLYDAFTAGESIVVPLKHLLSSVDRLSRSAEQTLRRRASAELFLTPRHAQAFDVHFDLHDVLFLQLEGAKTWRIYEPIVENPSPMSAESRLCGDRVGEPLSVFEVRKGDLLYIPLGFPHQGTTGDESSLHITIGLSPTYVYDFLKALVEVAARDHPILRRPLRGAFSDAGAIGLDGPTLAECQRILASADLVDKAVERLEEQFVESLDPVETGRFAEIDRGGEIVGRSLCEQRPDQICAVRTGPGTSAIHFIGGRVSGPAWIEPQLRWIAATQRFRVQEIPGDLSLDSKIVLVRRLINEGFLRTVGADGDGAG